MHWRHTARPGRWSGSTARWQALRRQRRTAWRAADPDDGLRSIDQAIPAVRARATARNAIRPRHRRCGEPAIAAAPAPISASTASVQASDAIRRSICAVFSGCPSDGKRRHAVAITSRKQLAVTAVASRSRIRQAQWRHRGLSGNGMASSRWRGPHSVATSARWIKPHLKARWGKPARYRNFISVGVDCAWRRCSRAGPL